MTAEKSPHEDEIFRSDVIDLSDVDLTEVNRLPSPVLRAAVQRVCEEIGSSGQVSAYFQSSLRGPPAAGGSWTRTRLAGTGEASEVSGACEACETGDHDNE